VNHFEPALRAGNAAGRYFAAAEALIAELWETQQGGIERAAHLVAQTLQRDGLIYVSGSGHSHMLAEELFYRAGGLAAVAPLLESSLMLHEGAVKSSGLERLEGYAALVLEDAGVGANDLLIVASNSGRNSYPIELALEAGRRGCSTVAVTSMATTSRVDSRHSSGEKLASVADVVLDNRVPYGDAVLDLPGMPSHVGPLSTIAGVTLLNAVVVRAVEMCVEAGHVPEVYQSANLQEGASESAGPDLDRWRARVRCL